MQAGSRNKGTKAKPRRTYDGEIELAGLRERVVGGASKYGVLSSSKNWKDSPKDNKAVSGVLGETDRTVG